MRKFGEVIISTIAPGAEPLYGSLDPNGNIIVGHNPPTDIMLHDILPGADLTEKAKNFYAANKTLVWLAAGIGAYMLLKGK